MCICCLSCCCRNSTMKYISQTFLLLILINFLLAILICLIPAANVKRYDKAKQYMEYFSEDELRNGINVLNDLVYLLKNKKDYQGVKLDSHQFIKNGKQ